MTKEQQRESAMRILEKEPLTGEEMIVLEDYEKLPPYAEDVKESAEHRECLICGQMFTSFEMKEEKFTAMQQWADHIFTHQPTPAQWAEAYKRIRHENRPQA